MYDTKGMPSLLSHLTEFIRLPASLIDEKTSIINKYRGICMKIKYRKREDLQESPLFDISLFRILIFAKFKWLNHARLSASIFNFSRLEREDYREKK